MSTMITVQCDVLFLQRMTQFVLNNLSQTYEIKPNLLITAYVSCKYIHKFALMNKDTVIMLIRV